LAHRSRALGAPRRGGRRRTYDRLMERFANALPQFPAGRPASAELAWLAGLLEAEGTFLCPPPSAPNCPVVSCRMTDRDVVERVAERFGTAVLSNDKGRYRTEYAAVLKGSGAVAFMADIKPLMGIRRQQAIDEAIGSYTPPTRKLNFSDAEEIRRRSVSGESVSSLARFYKVARQTIHPILQGRIYRMPPSRPWRVTDDVPREAITPPDISSEELHWLAGWLEGEGSFMAPPPSDPRRPRISAQARDKDVVAEAGRLFRIKPVFDKSVQRRNPSWSAIWRVLLQGNRAIGLMLALEPLMGVRRRDQIRAAVTTAIKQGLDASASNLAWCNLQNSLPNFYGGGRT
jgi:hypothetical protein